MAVETEILNDLVIAHLGGDIDHHGAKALRDHIDNVVVSSSAKELELDFREVAFMDSSGIGLVMGRYRLMQEMGGTLHLSNVAAHLRKVMVLAGLDRLAILDKPVQRNAVKKEQGEDVENESNQFNETAI